MPSKEFLANHRGGSGALICINVHRRGYVPRVAIFSCIETADEWKRAQPDQENTRFIYFPMIVDDPDWLDTQPDLDKL